MPMTLEEISDRFEINDLLIRYCTALDARNFDAFDEIFTHSMAPAVASKQRQVTKTGAVKLLKRPSMVVAAKMSMSR